MIRDVIENAGLEGFAEIGLILFLVAFLLVVIRVVLMDSETAEEHAQIPLNDDELENGTGEHP